MERRQAKVKEDTQKPRGEPLEGLLNPKTKPVSIGLKRREEG
jgi:hypothetical protein